MSLRVDIIAAALSILALQTNEAATVRGLVRAEGSLEPIRYAFVQLEGANRAVETDLRGYYVIGDVAPGEWTLRVEALGYEPVERRVRVEAGAVVTLDVLLTPRPLELAGLRVEAERAAAAATEPGPAPARIDAAVVDAMPALFEADVLRAVQRLPSVQAASDFSAAPYVRGGTPDQTILLLDGLPLFNAYHLGGLFSAIDPDAISSVRLYAGAFPARLGDRLSGVIEIDVKAGGRDRIRGSGGIGLLSSRAHVNGPLNDGKGSFVATVRRTYVDLFSDVAHAVGLIPGTIPYDFTDAYLRLTHDVGGGRLSLAGYVDLENVDLEDALGDSEHSDHERANFDWGSRLLSLRYWKPLTPSLILEARAGVSDFRGDFLHERDVHDPATGELLRDSVETRIRALSVTRDALAALDLTWHAGAHTVRSGVQLDAYLLSHDIGGAELASGEFIEPMDRRDEPTTLALYIADEWRAGDRLSLRAGLRTLYAGERGTALLPRFGARYALNDRLAFTFGGGRSAQVVHSLRNEEALLSSVIAYDLLAATPADAPLPTAEDVVVGVVWDAAPTTVRLGAYLKLLHDVPLPPLPAGDPFDAPVAVADGFVPRDGTSRGVELSIEHAREAVTFSANYSLASTTIHGAVDYKPRFERTHMADASALIPWGDDASISARLQYGSGQPYTPIEGLTVRHRHQPGDRRFGGGGNTIAILGEHNAARLPAYLRLDVAARKSFEKHWFGSDVTITPYLSVLNVLNTPNVLFAMPQAYNDRVLLEYPPQVPILPTFGVEWRF